MSRSLTCLVFLLLTHSIFFGQSKRAFHWYFGWKAGVDFLSGSARANNSGQLVSIEGSSSISDTAGNLLFYSNGEDVWNRNNSIMPNGRGLMSNNSSTQSSLIVPFPGNGNDYYLFTSAGPLGESTGLRYNVIDMNLEGGLGNVISKNDLLFENATEELAATMHCNSKDYWIVARQMVTDTLKFYAYLLTSRGLSQPVISAFAKDNPSWNMVGSLTFSGDGKLLAFTSAATEMYLFDFDTQSGRLTIRNIIQGYAGESMYSNAFSPDNTRLYITSWVLNGFNYLSQFSLTAPDIGKSRINVDSTDYRYGTPNGYGYIGQIKLAPDQRIYVSRWNQDYPYQINPETFYSLDSLDVIHAPNAAGLSCNLQRNFLHLKGQPSMLGLPNFVSNFLSPTTIIQKCKSEKSEDFSVRVFPNPFSSKIFVTTNLQGTLNLRARLIDPLGRVIPTLSRVNSNSLELTVGFLARSVYFLQVFRGDQLLYTKKVTHM